MGAFSQLPEELIIVIAEYLQNESSQEEMRSLYHFALVNKIIYDWIMSRDHLWAPALDNTWIYSSAGLHGFSSDLHKCTPPQISATTVASSLPRPAPTYLKRRRVDYQLQARLKAMLYADSGRLSTALAICDDCGADAADRLYHIHEQARHFNDTEVMYWSDQLLQQIGFRLGERLFQEIQTRPKLAPWDNASGIPETLDTLYALYLVKKGRLNTMPDLFEARKEALCHVRDLWIHSSDCSDAHEDLTSLSSSSCSCDPSQAWHNVDQALYQSDLPKRLIHVAKLLRMTEDLGYIGRQALTSTVMSDLGHPTWLVELHQIYKGEPRFEEREFERMYETALVSGDINGDPCELLYFCYTWSHTGNVDLKEYGFDGLAEVLRGRFAESRLVPDKIKDCMRMLHGADLAANIAAYQYESAMFNAEEQGQIGPEMDKFLLPLGKAVHLTCKELTSCWSTPAPIASLDMMKHCEILSVKPWLDRLSKPAQDMESKTEDCDYDSRTVALSETFIDGVYSPSTDSECYELNPSSFQAIEENWHRFDSAVRYISRDPRTLPRFSCGTIVRIRSSSHTDSIAVIYGYNDRCSASWDLDAAAKHTVAGGLPTAIPQEPFYSVLRAGKHEDVAESDLEILSCPLCGDRAAPKSATPLTVSSETQDLERWVNSRERLFEEELRWLFRQAKNAGYCGLLPARTVCNPGTSTFWPAPPRACKISKRHSLENYDRFLFGASS